MARINVDDEIGNDPRFIKLLMNLKGDYYRAIGFCVGAWRMGQKFHKDVDAKGIIPFDEWEQTEFGASFIECGLAIKKEGGVYVKGSKDKFAWLDQKSEAGKLGGKKSAEARSNKMKQNEASASTSSSETRQESSEPQSCSNETKPLTLTLPPALVLPLPGVLTNTLPLNPQGNCGSLKSGAAKGAADIKVELDALGIKPDPERVIALFNKILAGTGRLKHCRALGSSSLIEMMNTFLEFKTLEDWEELFLKVKENKKLTGQVKTVWLATLDWLAVKDNALKVVNGKYDIDFDDKTTSSISNEHNLSDEEISLLKASGEI